MHSKERYLKHFPTGSQASQQYISVPTRLFLQAREPVEAIKSLAPRRQPGQRTGRLHNIFFKRKQKTGRLDKQLRIRWTWSLRNVGLCRTTRISAWSLGMDRSPRLLET